MRPEPYRRPLPARRELPAHRITGEVLPPEEHWGEPRPYVGHPAPPTKHGWVLGAIVMALLLAGVLALSSLPEIVGWFR